MRKLWWEGFISNVLEILSLSSKGCQAKPEYESATSVLFSLVTEEKEDIKQVSPFSHSLVDSVFPLNISVSWRQTGTPFSLTLNTPYTYVVKNNSNKKVLFLFLHHKGKHSLVISRLRIILVGSTVSNDSTYSKLASFFVDLLLLERFLMVKMNPEQT